MSMPLSEYNRSRPASALGGVSSTIGSVNPTGKSSYTNGKSNKTRTSKNAASNVRENDYDSDELDFDAYKRNYFPHTAVGNDVENGTGHGRSSSALGVANPASYFNDGVGGTGSDYGLRSRSNSSGTYLSNPNPLISTIIEPTSHTESMATRGRLKRIREGLNASQQQGRTAIGVTSSSARPSKSVAAVKSPPRSSAEPSSTVGDQPTKDSSQAKPPPSPSSSTKSGDSDFSLSDIETLQNGIAARKHYRQLEAKLKQKREAFKKRPENHGRSEQELTLAAKSIELENQEERELFQELWEYVERDGKLGPCWERFCLQQTGELEAPFGDSDDEDDIDKRIDDIRAEEERSLAAAGQYGDDLEEPYHEVVDLASIEQERMSSTYGNRPKLQHLRSISTSDLPIDQNAPSSATNSANHINISNYTQPSQNSPSLDTPDDLYDHPRSRSVSTGGGRYQVATDSYSRAPNIPYEPPRDQMEAAADEEEEDVPVSQGNKFQKLALNDTLQLRHQQLLSGSQNQPSNAAYTRSSKGSVYAPPTRTQRTTRGERGSSDDRAGRDRSPTVNERAVQEARRTAKSSTNASSTATARTRSRTGYAQSTSQSQTGTIRATGRQRFEEREVAISSADERVRANTQHTQRPGSSRSLRDEDRERQRAAAATSTNGRRSLEEDVEEPAQYRAAPHPHIQEALAVYHSGGPVYLVQPTETIDARPHSPTAEEKERSGWGSHAPQGGPAHNRAGQGLTRSASVPANEPANSQPSQSNSAAKTNTVTVNKNQYQRLELIGKGGSSKVYRVLRLRDNRQFAMKRVELNSVDDEAVRNYTTEIALLRRLSGHDCVVRLIDEELKGRGSGTLHLIMELGETDFARLLAERQGKPIHLPWITMYFKQMLDAVNVIHEERIVHSDLKPANFVLIRGCLKLIDFGIAKAIANDTTNIQRESQIGTLNYMSPEAMDAPPGSERYKLGRPSDVWSLGCILYQMVYGVAPFAAYQNMHQKIRAITDSNHVIDFPEYAIPAIPKERSGTGRPEPIPKAKVKVPADMIDTMRRCLDHNAKARPTIPQLLAEPWLNGFAAGDGYERNETGIFLAEDEAVISLDNMQSLIAYVLRTHIEDWDGEDPDNLKSVHAMAERLIPELRSVRPDTQ